MLLEQKPRGASAGDFQPVPGQPAEGVLTGNGGAFDLRSENTDYRATFKHGSNQTTSGVVRVNVGL